MTERSNYNERFAFADPGDVRTLYRSRKRAYDYLSEEQQDPQDLTAQPELEFVDEI